MRNFSRRGIGAAAGAVVALAALVPAIDAGGAPDAMACNLFAAALLSLSLLYVARRKARR